MNGWEQNDRAAAIAAQAWVNDGAKQERERIIALLKSKIEHDWKENYCEACDQTDYLIALIKGENK